MQSRRQARLTPKQEAFAREFVRTGNGSRAYRAAYDAARASNETVAKEAQRLLRHPRIAPIIAELAARVREDAGIEAGGVLLEMWAMGTSRITDYVQWNGGKVTFTDPDELTKEQVGAIQSLKIKTLGVIADGTPIQQLELKMHDRVTPLKLVGQHLGMWKDQKGEQEDEELATERQRFEAMFAAMSQEERTAWLREQRERMDRGEGPAKLLRRVKEG